MFWKNLLFCGLLFTNCGYAHAITDLGVVGKVYSIKERDALEEVEAKAKTVDWKKEFGKIKPEKYRPKDLRNLPRAQKSSSFLVDMTYTLDMDIPDGKGGILYPKGYTFNPLDYIPFRKVMVVINAEDKDQVSWFKKSPYAGRVEVMLLITDGSFVDTAKAVKHPVFYAMGKLVDRFNLKAVPSIVRQDGRFMLVEEVLVPKTKEGRP